jgi:hypothetical protein
MLTLIRRMLGITPSNDTEVQDFMTDGFQDVLRRGYHALCCWDDGLTQKRRQESYADRYMFTELEDGSMKKMQSVAVLGDGSIRELIDYIFSPQGLIDRYDKRSWNKNYALAHAPIPAFTPGRKVIAFPVVTPPQR